MQRWGHKGMGKPFLWIIDDEWDDYEREKAIFAEAFGEDGYELAFSGPDTYLQDLTRYGDKADALLTQIDITLGAAEMRALKRCKIISNYGTGYNNIDLRAAKQCGIAVGYIPGYCAEDIAEYVLAVLFRRFKPVDGFARVIRAGLWGAPALRGEVHRLQTKELFLVGFGSIARAVAKKARAVGLQVSAWSPHLTPQVAEQFGVLYRSLEEGLKTADVVSLHMRYDPATHHLIGKAELAMMKSDALLINTARGGVLDTAALIEAVKRGALGGAVLDVLEQEPPTPEDAVLSCEGIEVTPHISYCSAEALGDLQRRAARNAALVLQGKPGADLVAV